MQVVTNVSMELLTDRVRVTVTKQEVELKPSGVAVTSEPIATVTDLMLDDLIPS